MKLDLKKGKAEKSTEIRLLAKKCNAKNHMGQKSPIGGSRV